MRKGSESEGPVDVFGNLAIAMVGALAPKTVRTGRRNPCAGVVEGGLPP
jgi:hypothetical protein